LPRFSHDAAPTEIYTLSLHDALPILTHGHFDHVGSIVGLLEKWKVPVYSHALEVPFLTGRQAYPEPDVTVQGGMLAKISSIYPRSEEHTSELQSRENLVCRLLLEKKN